MLLTIRTQVLIELYLEYAIDYSPRLPGYPEYSALCYSTVDAYHALTAEDNRLPKAERTMPSYIEYKANCFLLLLEAHDSAS